MKEEEIIQSIIEYTEQGHLQARCGKCGNSISFPDLTTGQAYEYSQYCPKCGLKIRFAPEAITLINKISKIIAYVKGGLEKKPKIIVRYKKLKVKKSRWKFWK